MTAIRSDPRTTPARGSFIAKDHPRYKWIVLSNTTLGVLMATINASIVMISLPAIFSGIHLNPLQPGNVSYLLWMIMGYLLVTAVLVTGFGRLGDMLGRVRIYNAGFVVFSIGAVALALDPWTGPRGAMWLILWRLLQAVGARCSSPTRPRSSPTPSRRTGAEWRWASTRSPAWPAPSSASSSAGSSQ